MARRRGFVSAVLVLLLGVCAVQPLAQADRTAVCPIALVGIWKPAVTPEADPIFLRFAADGWVSLLMGSGETRADDFDVIDQVRYGLNDPHLPTHIEFRARRGSDMFPPGTTAWEIAKYGDGSFTTINRESGEQSVWTRVQTHRYFLTFAARRGTGGPAFAMWTKLDGRRTELEALGVHAATDGRGGATLVFGRVPAPLSSPFTTEGDPDSAVMMRLELTEAEYRRTHEVFEIWARRADDRVLAGDPVERLMEFFQSVDATVNQCADKLRRDAAEAPTPGAAERPLEFIRRMRALNRGWHVSDGVFPFVWEPPPVQ